MTAKLPHLQVAIGVVERHGRYLVGRRRKPSHLAGYWEFPGGKRHPGESWQACLRRELLEEVNIAVRIVRRLAPLVYRYPSHSVRMEVFRCRQVAGRPKPLGCAAVRWVTLAELRSLRFPPANQPLVRRLLRLHPRRRRGIIVKDRQRRDHA